MAKEAKKQIDEPFDESIAIKIAVYREVPKKWSLKRIGEALDGNILPKTRPDLDNYLKAILDGLSGIAFTDDNLICRIEAEKWYGKPRAEIEITPMRELLK